MLVGWIRTLELLTPIAKTIPLLGSPLEGSLEAAVEILKFAQSVKTNKEQTKELAEQAARWTQALVNALDNAKTDAAELEHMRPDVTPISEVLDVIAEAIRRRAKQSLAKQMMNRSKNEDELAKLRDELKDDYERFMVSSQIRAQNALSTVLKAVDTDTLKQLMPIPSARYASLTSPSGCLPGTRQGIIAQLLTWAEEPTQDMSMLWLSGLAGTGKSAIAKTFCEQQAGKSTLMTTFFASRSSAERRNPFNVIHTFAYELATVDARIRPHVLSAVRSPPDIMHCPMTEQIERLLATPLRQAQSGRTLVLVIDALDECDRIDRVESGALILLLADVLRSLPVKLLVTSRQEPSLVRMFKSLPHVPLRLLDIAAEAVELDVSRVLESGFAEIRKQHDLTKVSWPSQADLDSLVRLTGRFFIFASTALRYIGDSHFSPTEQLCRVLARGDTLDGEAPYAQIDALYTDILQAATRDDSGKFNARLCRRVSDLLRTVVLLEEPLSAVSLAELMNGSETDIAKAVDALAAFLFVADTHKSSVAVVQIFHPSLRDFLCDTERCRDTQFLVDTSVHHQMLSSRCLLMLNRSLRHDICRLENPARANTEISDLMTRLQEHVSGAVQYACVFWPVHLTAGESLSNSLCMTLLEFCQAHLLHWVELLSLLRRLLTAAVQLPTAVSWCRSSDVSVGLTQEVSELLNDCYRMLLTYYPPIYSHALHVYESAVVTMPTCALFAIVNADTTTSARLISAREHGWTATLRVIEGHSHSVRSVAFSPDGTQLASGSSDGTVRLWNARTGDQLAVLNHSADDANPSSTTAITFSPDGSQLVSNSHKGTVRLWDASTYVLLLVLRDCRDSVDGLFSPCLSLAFSPTGSFVAYGCADGTFYVWDFVTSTEKVVIKGSEAISAVACSPDGNRVVYGLSDGAMHVWDLQTGRRLSELEGHNHVVTSIYYSPDGARLVSGSLDQTIRIWNTRTDEPISVLRGHSGEVTSVAFSPDGRQVVSGSHGNTVSIWDVHSTKQLAVLQGHRDWVSSVVFSPDGTKIVSGSHDCTIRVWDMQSLPRSAEDIDSSKATNRLELSPDGRYLVSTAGKHGRVWDVQTGKQTAALGGHTDGIVTAAFSPNPDGLRIATGSSDHTVRLWNTETGEQLAEFSDNEDTVVAVALSLDNTRVVSGSKNNTIRVWDVSTGERLALFAGHEHRVTAVALSPNGSQVVSGSYDARTIVWDVLSGAQLALLDNDGPPVASITFSFDGMWLYTTHDAGAVFHGPILEHHWQTQTTEVSFQELAWDFHDIVTHRHGPSPRKVTSSTTAMTTGAGTGDMKRQTRDDTISLAWNKETGWMSCMATSDSETLLPLCWLPVERRGHKIVLCGWKAMIGGVDGNVTILDFTNAINRLASVASI